MCHVRRTIVVGFLSIGLTLIANLANGQQLDRGLIGTFPKEGGPITISTTGDPVVTSELLFSTRSGSLTLGRSPAPFDSSLQTGPQTRFSSESPVVFDGSVTIEAFASRNATFDAGWAKPFENIHNSFPLLGGDAIQTSIQGYYPFNGGPITINSVIPGVPVNVRSLELTASEASLEFGGSSAPFASLPRRSTRS